MSGYPVKMSNVVLWPSCTRMMLSPCHLLFLSLFSLFPVVDPVCTLDQTHPPPPPHIGLQFPAGPWNNVILQQHRSHLYYFLLQHLASHTVKIVQLRKCQSRKKHYDIDKEGRTLMTLKKIKSQSQKRESKSDCYGDRLIPSPPTLTLLSFMF